MRRFRGMVKSPRIHRKRSQNWELQALADMVFPLSQIDPWLCYSIRAELVKFADGEYKED